MASITIRNLDDEFKTRLRTVAANLGVSMEQAAWDILRRAVQTPPPLDGLAFAMRINQRAAGMQVDKLPIPTRRQARVINLAG